MTGQTRRIGPRRWTEGNAEIRKREEKEYSKTDTDHHDGYRSKTGLVLGENQLVERLSTPGMGGLFFVGVDTAVDHHDDRGTGQGSAVEIAGCMRILAQPPPARQARSSATARSLFAPAGASRCSGDYAGSGISTAPTSSWGGARMARSISPGFQIQTSWVHQIVSNPYRPAPRPARAYAFAAKGL